MVTRRNRPEMDAPHTEEELRILLSEQTFEVTQLRQRIGDLELLGTRFLASASHAVMNPITIIRSYLEIILSDLEAGLSSEHIEFVKTAHSATLMLNRLIDGMVELAALEMGAAELEMATVKAGNLVAEVSRSHAPSAETAGIEFCVSITSDLPRVRADDDRLRNAIGEILLNAIQWTPRGGRVEITAARRGADVVIGVTDTGRGIPEDQLDEVFEPFVRLRRREGELRRGAGLGLSVARRQIEAMGGGVGVSSEVGSGTAFEILLPASTEDV